MRYIHPLFRLSFVTIVAAWFLGGAKPAQAQFLILAQGDETVEELQNGSSLTLSSEGIGAAVATNISVRFTGPESSTATISEPTLNGSTTFRVTTAATLPALIRAGQDVDFQVTFTPTGTGPFSARLTLNLRQNDIGRPVTTREVLINLSGRAADYTVSFELPGGNETLLPDNGLLQFPDTSLESSSTATIIVRNRGAGPGTMTGVEVMGEAFAVAGLQLLPSVIGAGGDLRFSVIFTPSRQRTFDGALRITFGVGSRSAQLAGTEAASSLLYETTIGTTSRAISPGESITLSLAGSEVLVRVTNPGSAERLLSSISVSGAAFSTTGLPFLPARLASGSSLAFSVEFTPTQPGVTTGELLINSSSFPLIGEVPSLPAVSIGGGGRQVEPAAQLPIGVSLAEPYGADLVGDLILTFTSSAFSNDPAVQFSTGGRTASFFIPAHETEARFASGVQEVLLQTGTVAGTILLEAFFDADAAGVDLTPDLPPATVLSLPRAAPRLRRVELSSIDQSVLTLQITGFATARTVNDLQFQLTGAAGSNLQTTTLQANVTDPFNLWYQSSQSVSFGSQFTATVDLLVDGDISAIQTVSVRALNELGGSESVSVNIQ